MHIKDNDREEIENKSAFLALSCISKVKSSISSGVSP
jgi:hypothetical protein